MQVLQQGHMITTVTSTVHHRACLPKCAAFCDQVETSVVNMLATIGGAAAADPCCVYVSIMLVLVKRLHQHPTMSGLPVMLKLMSCAPVASSVTVSAVHWVLAYGGLSRQSKVASSLGIPHRVLLAGANTGAVSRLHAVQADVYGGCSSRHCPELAALHYSCACCSSGGCLEDVEQLLLSLSMSLGPERLTCQHGDCAHCQPRFSAHSCRAWDCSLACTIQAGKTARCICR